MEGRAERTAKDLSLTNHYAQAILWSEQQAQSLSCFTALDAWFAKASFINYLLRGSGRHVISRLELAYEHGQTNIYSANVYYRFSRLIL